MPAGVVAARVAAIQQNIPAMSDDLKRWLDLVWTHRRDHRQLDPQKRDDYRHASAYAIYSKKRSTSQHSTRSTSEFLEGLLTMPFYPEIQCHYYNYSNNLTYFLRKFYRATVAQSGFAKLTQRNFQSMVEDARNLDNLNESLTHTFYHFRRTVGTRSKFRIYLNVRPLHVIRVMRFVVNNIVLQPNAHPHITNAKVGPPGATARADAIIIYLSQESAIKTTLDALTAFQKAGNHNYFEHGAPRSTKPISRHNSFDLKGVGVGAEPPFKLDHRYRAVRGASSFGSFRSQVIELALYRTMLAKQDKGDFVDRAARYLQRMGIDPRQPHLHRDIRRG